MTENRMNRRMITLLAGVTVGLGSFGASARAAGPTFTKDVAPIVFNNCATCHRAGEVAPFSLTSYAETKKHAKQIADVVDDRMMPPWKPEPGHGDFLGAR